MNTSIESIPVVPRIDIEETKKLVTSMLGENRLEEASALLSGVLARDPENVFALHALGIVRFRQGSFERAIDLLGRAIVKKPSNYILYANLADAYRADGQTDLAINTCRIAIRIEPKCSEAFHTLGIIFNEQGRYSEAVKHLEIAIQINPNLASIHNNLGMALLKTDRRSEAIEHFRRALELDSTLQRAKTNLGLALLDDGQTQEALSYFREAVEHQPDFAILHHNLGLALRAAGKHEESRASFLNALYLDSELPAAHIQVGSSLRLEGDVSGAIQWFQYAEDLVPENIFVLKQLAELHREDDNGFKSIDYWQRFADKPGANKNSAELGIANALQDEGSIEEALARFQALVPLMPDDPAPHLGIASALEQSGRMAEAEIALRAALPLKPPIAYARLATLLRSDLPDEDLEAIVANLAAPELDSFDRGRLLYGLAHVLDSRSKFEDAADCVREASEIKLSHVKPAEAYKAEDHTRFVDSIIDVFNQSFFTQNSGLGSSSREPVFVFGLPRSGTTLIEQILASHSQVHGAGELRLVKHSLDMIPTTLGRPMQPMACLPFLTQEAIQTIADEHLKKLRTLGHGAARIVDKMPDNYAHLGFLAVLFPNATFVHCRRSLRDVAVSCRMTDFRKIRWSCSPEALAARFREYLRLMDHWQSVLPMSLIEVDYEDTVADIEVTARRLLDACQLDWEPACVEFHLTKRPVRTASLTQVRKPVYTRSVERWRNYERAMNDVFSLLPND